MNCKTRIIVALFLIVGVDAAAQIRPLDENRLREATAENAALPGNDLRLSRLMNGRSSSSLQDLDKMKQWPFTITIETPYYRAFALAAEARRKFQAPPTLTVDDLNSQNVVVRVTAGPSFLTADVVEGFVIKRGEVVIRPSNEKVVPTIVSNAMGATRSSAIGYFEFPISAFAPEAGPFTAIVIGKGGNFEWEVNTDDLYAMKD